MYIGDQIGTVVLVCGLLPFSMVMYCCYLLVSFYGDPDSFASPSTDCPRNYMETSVCYSVMENG